MSGILSSIDALVLCGGAGTRLKCPMHPSMPKALAEIDGRPFIHLLLETLEKERFRSITMLAGHGAGYLRGSFGRTCLHSIVEDDELLGTGPAIKRVLIETQRWDLSDPFLVLNGDTFIPHIDFNKMLGHHLSNDPIATVAHVDGIHAWAFYLNHRILAVMKEMEGKFNLEDVLKRSWKTDRLSYYGVSAFHDIGTPESLEDFRRWYNAGEAQNTFGD